VSGIDDRSILAVLVNAVKALAAKVSDTAHLIIATLTAHRVETDELCLKDGSGTSCYTRAQLDAMVAGVSAGAPQQGRNDAPATAPASDRSNDADSSATSTDTSAASSTPAAVSPSSTDEGPADAPALDEGEADVPEEPELEPAQDPPNARPRQRQPAVRRTPRNRNRTAGSTVRPCDRRAFNIREVARSHSTCAACPKSVTSHLQNP
jgi:hypothetical protein